jgi:hypothetical protein
MVIGLVLAVGLGFLADSAPPAARSASSPAGSAWAEANALARTLAELQQHARSARGKDGRLPPRRFVVTQSQANAYLNLRMRSQLPAGLKNIDIEFQRGKIRLTGLVDLDQVKAAAQADSMFNPMSYLSGVVPVELQGALKAEKGFGQFEIEDARLGPVMVPPSVIYQIVAGATRTAGDQRGFDVLSPFRLPYSLRRVGLEPGKLVLEF